MQSLIHLGCAGDGEVRLDVIERAGNNLGAGSASRGLGALDRHTETGIQINAYVHIRTHTYTRTSHTPWENSHSHSHSQKKQGKGQEIHALCYGNK